MKHHKNQLLLQLHKHKTRAPLAALNMRKLNSDNGLNNLRHEEAYALLHPDYRLWDVVEL